MAISYVGEAQYTFSAASGTTDIRAGIPSAVQTGDLLICCYGNVGNATSVSTMNNSWTKLEEDTSGSNCYFLMAAKIATATEVSAAGSNVSIATAAGTTTGQTTKSAQTMAYRGTKTTVATAVIDSNFTHESSPADQTINTNTATATAATQWYVCFFNMADSGDATASSWSSTASTFRGDAEVFNGPASPNVSSGCAGYDSNGTITTGSKSFNGTWSGSATRLNAGIAILDPAQVDHDANAETISNTATSNSPKGSVGAKAQVIG